MNIEIGYWPDFVLTRGHEILSYRFKIVIHRPNQRSETRILTHRSLAMICKEAKSIYRYAGSVKSEPDIEIEFFQKQITIGVKTSDVGGVIVFVGPDGVSPDKIQEILRNVMKLLLCNKLE